MDKKHPLDTNTNEDNSTETKNLEEKRARVEGGQSQTEDQNNNSTLLKSLAIVGVVILILIGLYGSFRVMANLPDFGRSLASGFVSVTSQFFGTDEEEGDTEDTDKDRVIVIENDDEEDEDEEAEVSEEDQEEDNQPQTQTPRTSTQPTQTRTITREFRTVPQTISTRPVSDPNGEVDLEVKILAVGKIHPRTRDFVEQDELDEDDTGAVVFEVKNIGTKTSEEWEYRATFPTDPRHTFDSNEQMELRPGERIEYTISFDSLSESNNEFAVEVDPGRDIDDVERDNNRVEIDIDIRD